MSRLTRFVILGAIVALGGWLRCSNLSATGFSEDEIDIVRATAAYQHLDLSANAEHPMLAKLAAFASTEAAEAINRIGRSLGAPRISRETAIRFPMAFVGGVLTTVAVYLLATELFADPLVPLIAALLWAGDVNATSINRTAKEDTLFLFFFVLAAWLYARAKWLGAASPPDARPWYVASGAAFGLMMASKYMPYYYGLHALVYHIVDPHPGENRPNPRHTFGAMAAAFLLGNFAVFLPSSWARLEQYFGGHTLIHTGYLFAHHLYVNSIFATPGGVPTIFYVAFLFTKVPLIVLAAFALGVVEMVRHPAERGFVFARVFLVLVLLPYSLLGSKFVRYILPLLAIVDLLAAVGIARVVRLALVRPALPAWRFAAVGIALIAVAVPISTSVAARPYFCLAQNSIGARLGHPGYLFPDDEFNDMGVREAVAEAALVASPGATIASDATTVVEEYLIEYGRPDIRARSISRDGLPVTPTETWVFAQEGHTYYENQAVLETVRLQHEPWQEVKIANAVALGVYRLPGPRALAATAATAVPDVPVKAADPPPRKETRSSQGVRARATRDKGRSREVTGSQRPGHPLQRQ